jgi:hypothetical protein
VPEVVLKGARVLAIIGQFETAGMAEHVRMHAEWHLRSLPESRVLASVSMIHLLILAVHLLATIAKLVRRAGYVRSWPNPCC